MQCLRKNEEAFISAKGQEAYDSCEQYFQDTPATQCVEEFKGTNFCGFRATGCR